MRRSVAQVLFLVVALLLLQLSPAGTQPPARVQPRLEPVAETRLLMEGLNQSNFRGLSKHLKEKPADPDTWTFVRGQALLIAETGNLLMMRPPRNQGEAVWLDRAIDLRSAATRLARAASESDYPRSRAALAGVADACNRCHQTFRVPVRLNAFPEPEKQD